MKKLRLVVISDGEMIPEFAKRALAEVTRCDEVFLLSCTNSQSRRQPFRHALYYLLNILSIRNSLTRLVPAEAAGKRILEVRRFAAEEDKGWQRFPADVIAWLNGIAPDAILKFGMNLLRVPEELAAPILSYHHGDPEHYRGRPAGFYELLHGSPMLGQMVQIIGNRLDAGTIVAFGETKVYPQSYRSTLREAFRHSPLLLPAAIDNALAGHSLARPVTGRHYRLPSNAVVLRFSAKLLLAKIRRAAYGAFWEKAWRVSLAPAPPGAQPSLPTIDPEQWTTLPTPPDSRFLADPFFSKEQGGVLVESLNRRRNLGEILLWDGQGYRPLVEAPGHVSYPATALVDGRELIVPEIASWSSPRVYAGQAGEVGELATLRVEGEETVLDPTLVQHDGRLYLFGNIRAYPNALFLWSANGIDDPFVRHPSAPILISPKGARMGGAIWQSQGQLYRLGQNWLTSYGDGLYCFRIDSLGTTTYRETALGELRFHDRRGPHTLNSDGARLVFDWYEDRFSLTAGLRRALARLG